MVYYFNGTIYIGDIMKNICEYIKIIDKINKYFELFIIIVILFALFLLIRAIIKVRKKKSAKAKKYFKRIVLIDILLLVIPIIIFFIMNNINDKKDTCINNKEKKITITPKKEETNTIPSEEPKDETPEKEEIKNIEETKKPIENNTSNEEKLKKLNNINNSLSFFLMDNLDRYISYKDKNTNLTDEQVVVRVNMGLDKEFYSLINNAPYPHTEKIIVNKYYNIGSDYVPTELESLGEYGASTTKLDKPAKDAFVLMCEAAKAEGLTIYGKSGYRSYSYQKTIYNNYLNRDPQAEVDTYSARPGHSEHQTGLAIDVSNSPESTYGQFGGTESHTWVQNNSYKYGYVIRYTTDTEFITGYKNEPWHLRYFGVDIATYLHDNNMTYEEYYVRFLQQ